MALKRRRSGSDVDMADVTADDLEHSKLTPPASTPSPIGTPPPAESHELDGEQAETIDHDGEFATAEVPFTVVMLPKRGPKKSAKKKKTAKGQHATTAPAAQEPATDGPTYIVKPKERWNSLKRFKKFVVFNETFSLGDFIFVKGDEDAGGGKDWVGKVHEVRAIDHEHVYVLVYWMYWPDELPQGRQPYHGVSELVQTTHLDIIDAMTVQSKADVFKYDDDDKQEPDSNNLYYRQTMDYLTQKLQPLKPRCACKKPRNPDKPMYICNHCNEWLHEKCLMDNARRAAKARLDEAKQSVVVVPDSQQNEDDKAVALKQEKGKTGGRGKAIKSGKVLKGDTLEELRRDFSVEFITDSKPPRAVVTDLRTCAIKKEVKEEAEGDVRAEDEDEKEDEKEDEEEEKEDEEDEEEEKEDEDEKEEEEKEDEDEKEEEEKDSSDQPKIELAIQCPCCGRDLDEI